MAEHSAKRDRVDSESSEFDESSSLSKRQRPLNNILNLLDEEEEPESGHLLSRDLSAIFTTLEQELSSSSDSATAAATATFDFEALTSTAEVEHSQPPASANSDSGEEDTSVMSVMRHLLEASDDELGIPNTGDEKGVEDFTSGENLPFGFTDNGLWELEDVAANYYSVLQSELFM